MTGRMRFLLDAITAMADTVISPPACDQWANMAGHPCSPSQEEHDGLAVPPLLPSPLERKEIAR